MDSPAVRTIGYGVARCYGHCLDNQRSALAPALGQPAVLDEVGPLFETVDSADWSGAVRRAAQRAGGDVAAAQRCPHGIVDYEQNCPVAAQKWAVEQTARAGAAPVQEALPIFA